MRIFNVWIRCPLRGLAISSLWHLTHLVDEFIGDLENVLLNNILVVCLALWTQVDVLHVYQFLWLAIVLRENNIILVVNGLLLLLLTCSWAVLLRLGVIISLSPPVFILSVTLLKYLEIFGLNLWLLELRRLRVRRLGVFLRRWALREVI